MFVGGSFIRWFFGGPYPSVGLLLLTRFPISHLTQCLRNLWPQFGFYFTFTQLCSCTGGRAPNVRSHFIRYFAMAANFVLRAGIAIAKCQLIYSSSD